MPCAGSAVEGVMAFGFRLVNLRATQYLPDSIFQEVFRDRPIQLNSAASLRNIRVATRQTAFSFSGGEQYDRECARFRSVVD
jgi:hypothetical protein